MAYQKTPDEFLKMIDLYILAKVTKAEETASQFTSQNEVSIELKKSYTSYIIPCLTGVRNDIEFLLTESKANNYNVKEAFGVLIYYITRKSIKMEALKQNCTDPIMIAGLSLVQGVYVDLMKEISDLAKINIYET